MLDEFSKALMPETKFHIRVSTLERTLTKWANARIHLVP